jgi:hypothetical protein
MTDSPVELDPDVEAVADLARAYGHNHGRLHFAGVAPEHEHHAITVYRVPDPAFDSAMRGLVGPDVALHLVDAPHTRDDLLVARERVWALADSLPVESISIPVDGSRLTVVVDAPPDDVQASLDRVVPGLATAVAATADTAVPR